MTLPSCDQIKVFFPGIRHCVLVNFLLMVQGIVLTRSCALYKCAEATPGDALFESRYKRLLRFVRMRGAEHFSLMVGDLLLALLPEQDKYYLVMDRTNWKLGASQINVLCLGVLLKDELYLPLLWVPLPKEGSSSQDERLALLERFCQLWPTPECCVLLADREFLGRTWITGLRQRGMSIIIRLREDAYLDEVMLSLQQGDVYRRIRRSVRRKGAFVAPITLAGCALYYIAVPNYKKPDEVVCLLSDSPDVAWVRQSYAKRWKIEVFFKQAKSDGFNLEDMHVVDLDRVRVLVAVVSFAYALALHQGIIEAKKRPIMLKKNTKSGKSWPAVSLFRYGYRRLRVIACQASRFIEFVLRIVRKWARSAIPPTAIGLGGAKSVQ